MKTILWKLLPSDGQTLTIEIVDGCLTGDAKPADVEQATCWTDYENWSESKQRFMILQESARILRPYQVEGEESGAVRFPGEDSEEIDSWAHELVKSPLDPKAEIAAYAARCAVAFVDEFDEPIDCSEGDWDGTAWAEFDQPDWITEAYDFEHGDGASFELFSSLLEKFSEAL